MAKQIIKVPDIGTDGSAEVVEVLIKAGDTIAADDPLIVLETEKASVEVPSSHGGKVAKLLVKEGDQLKTGAPIAELEEEGDSSSESQASADTEGEKKTEAVEQQDQAEAQATSKDSQKDQSKKDENEKSQSSEKTEKPKKSAAEPSANKKSAKSSSILMKVPDLGGASEVEVIEIYVKSGDNIDEGDSVIVLESEKASLEVPASQGGRVEDVLVKVGDKVKEGDDILRLADASVSASTEEEEPRSQDDNDGEQAAAPTKQKKTAPTGSKNKQAQALTVSVPDLGGAADVEVIEVYVKEGDSIAEGDSIIVLESEKASLEVPSSHGGTVDAVLVKVGDKLKEGDKILSLSGNVDAVDDQEAEAYPTPKAAAQESKSKSSSSASPKAKAVDSEKAQQKSAPSASARAAPNSETADGGLYAGPAVRKLARQLGVNLTQVKSSGPRGRHTKDDVRSYVRQVIAEKGSGSAIPKMPAIDFAQFGEIKKTKLSKIKRFTASNMHRSWLNVPHVTQFDDADISDLEDYRNAQKAEAEKRGVKLTPLPFLLIACARTLKAEPSFNVSMDSDGEYMIEKNYVHIGVAVDTPAGLLVPVIRDVDKKDIWQLAQETVELAQKARDGKLTPREMQGGCFTISSLGPIGGQGFTPIVNTPEVGILGVSKMSIKPQWDGKNFLPRKMLPLCLSYDHRAVNGADAGRFLTHLVNIVGKPDELL